MKDPPHTASSWSASTMPDDHRFLCRSWESKQASESRWPVLCFRQKLWSGLRESLLFPRFVPWARYRRKAGSHPVIQLQGVQAYFRLRVSRAHSYPNLPGRSAWTVLRSEQRYIWSRGWTCWNHPMCPNESVCVSSCQLPDPDMPVGYWRIDNHRYCG